MKTRAPALLTLLVAGVMLPGCFNPFDPLVRGTARTTPAPLAESPRGVLKLLEWCYRNRDVGRYEELFTDDYRFVFATLDTNGNAYRDQPFTREAEVGSTTNLFLGGDASQPAATDIQLTLGGNFAPFNDPRYPPHPGRKTIRTTVTLSISTSDGSLTNVQGSANFFLVRGDIALLPEQIENRFGESRNTRWFIERWEDETLPTGALRLPPPGDGTRVVFRMEATDTEVESPASPSEFIMTTMGAVKRRFLPTESRF